MIKKVISFLIIIFMTPNFAIANIEMPTNRPVSVFDNMNSYYNRIASSIIETNSNNDSAHGNEYIMNMSSKIAELKLLELEERHPFIKEIFNFQIDLLPKNIDQNSSNNKTKSNPVVNDQQTKIEEEVPASMKLKPSIRSKSLILSWKKGRFESNSEYSLLSNELTFSVNSKFKTINTNVDYNYSTKDISANATKNITKSLDLTVSAKTNISKQNNFTGLQIAYRF